MEYRDYYEILGVPAERVPGRHQEGLPQARPGASPGPQRRRQGRREAVQGRQRGQRRPVRPGQAQAVRPPRRELGPVPARRRRLGGRRPVRPGRPVRGVRRVRRRGGRAGPPASPATSATSSTRRAAARPGFSDFFRMFFSGAAAGRRSRRPASATSPASAWLAGAAAPDRRSRTSSAAWAWTARPPGLPGGAAIVGRLGPERPDAGRPRSRRRRSCRSRRRTTAPSAWSSIEGKRYEVQIPRGVGHRQPRPAVGQGARRRATSSSRSSSRRTRRTRAAAPTSSGSCR